MKSLIRKSAILVLFSTGVLILTYPFYVNALNSLVDQYRADKAQEQISEKQKEQLLEEKRKENERVKENGLMVGADPFSEGSESELTSKEYQTHLIGTVNIPKIGINVPLFDETTQRFLEKGATILAQGSFPNGEKNTHTIISAHSGLPERKLFTDLEKLKIKDIFVLFVLGENLAYEVDTIKVVKPNNTSTLRIVENQELTTLVTCTPYSINSHRLLVTGHRVPYTKEIENQMKAQEQRSKKKHFAVFISLLLFVLIVILLLVRVFQKEDAMRDSS